MRILLQEAFTKALYFKDLHKITDFERTQIISVHYQIVAPILTVGTDRIIALRELY